MVTAIVIPIICLYFYWVTRREMKEQNQKWLALNDIPEEAIISGKVIAIHEEKQRYYYHRYTLVTEIKLQTDYKTLIVKKVAPLTKDYQPVSISVGEEVKLFGNWKNGYFQFKRLDKIS